MASLRIEDFLAYYKSPDKTPNFQQYITGLKEFDELRGNPDEQLKSPTGSLYTHQVEFLRFLSHYPRGIYIAEPGTGKSCSLVALAEHFKNNEGHIKHVYFLTGNTQIEDLKRQLACVCTTGIYDKGLDLTRDETEQKKALTRNMGSWYTATTYGTFVREIKKKYSNPDFNQEIRRNYSGCIFFLDEVQKIKMKNVRPDGKISERVKTWTQIWRILHLAERSIQIISSARLIENNLSELGFHLNLINPLDKQLYYPIMEYVTKKTGIRVDYSNVDPITRKTTFDVRKAPMEDFGPYLRDKVLYVRALRTGAIPVFPTNRYRLIYLKMSPEQEKGYNNFKKGSVGNSLTEQNKEVFIPERQASNWIYPDGTFRSFAKYIDFDKQSGAIRANDQVIHQYLENGQVGHMSIKAAYVCQKAVTVQGKIYVFTQFDYDGGAYQLGLALQYGIKVRGFDNVRMEQFLENSSVMISESMMGVRPFCSTASSRSLIRSDFPKKARYAIITGSQASRKRTQAILELYNHPDNLMGDYLKVLIITPIAQVGINLTETAYVIAYESSWSPSQRLQAIFRAFRATSHQLTYNIKKAELVFRPGPVSSSSDESSRVIIRVPVDTLASITSTGEACIDEQISIYSRNKDIEITGRLRILKQWAVDCQLQKLRNVRSDDIDGTPECDYKECNYQCVDPEPDPNKGLSYETYDVYYINEIIKDIIEKIIRVEFRNQSNLIVEDLMTRYPAYTKAKYFYFAFEELIKTQNPVYDRFGRKSYVRMDNGVFFLSRFHPRNEPEIHVASSYYNNNLIGLKFKDLPEINREDGQQKLDELWIKLQNMNFKSQEFLEYMNSLTTFQHTPLIEKCITMRFKGQSTPLSEAILEKDNMLFFDGEKPNAQIERLKLTKLGRGVGIEIDSIPNGPRIAFHRVYNPRLKFDNFASVRKKRNVVQDIRVYEDGVWRDVVNVIEEEIYKNFFRGLIRDRVIRMAEKGFGLFGSYSLTDKGEIESRVIDIRTGIKDYNSRSENTGRICQTYTNAILIGMIYYLWSNYPNTSLRKNYEPIRLSHNNHDDDERRTYAIKDLNSAKRKTIKFKEGIKVGVGGELIRFEKMDTVQLIFISKWRKEPRERVKGGGKADKGRYYCDVIFDTLLEIGAVISTDDNTDPNLIFEHLLAQRNLKRPIVKAPVYFR